MLRSALIAKAQSGEPHFRWRGGDVSRLEGLTDAVFALSLTLLIVTLEVPQTYAELRAAFVQLPVFLCCFAVLYMIWHAHFQFHRRYGLEDNLTIVLNAVLLFLVLFYAFPLKFLFTALYTMILHNAPVALDAVGEPVGRSITGENMPDLMILYGAGFGSIYIVLMLLTSCAWRKRQALELDAYECAVTRWKILGHAIMAGFGLFAAISTWIAPGFAPFAGLSFFLLGPAMGWHGWKAGQAAERALAEHAAAHE